MKRILICLDGTWNAAGDAAAESDTNVVRLFRSAEHFRNPNQKSFYFKGVGTSPFEQIRGGVFGHGLFEQVKDGYLAVVNEYRPGDEVTIAGFSRGAYAARCLASLLAECGILRDHRFDLADFLDRRRIDLLWELYRNRKQAPEALRDFCQRHCHPPAERLVAAVAVWDTVGALGVPWEIFGDDKIAAAFDEHEKKRLHFVDAELSPRIPRGYHAVALDEQRTPFRPSLWSGARVNSDAILQVWFAGVHSNVGGGFPDRGLSDLSLDWMIRLLRKNHGLLLQDIVPDPEGIWDPAGKTGMDKIAGQIQSPALSLLKSRQVPAGSFIHPSVELRLRGDAKHPPLRTTATFVGARQVAPAV